MDLEIEIKVNDTAIDTDDKIEVEEEEVVGAKMEGNTTEIKTGSMENKEFELNEEEVDGAEEDKDEEDLEDDDGDEAEDSIDICVDDTQPVAIMSVAKAEKRTSWNEFDDAYSDGPVIAPTNRITLDPNPTCPMSPPSFPYTSGSPEVSAPGLSDLALNDTVFRSKVKSTDTQSSTTHFTASETVGGGVELIISPKLLYNTSATVKDEFITASVPDALPSPAMATKGSDTCQASVPEMKMSSTKTGEACSLRCSCVIASYTSYLLHFLSHSGRTSPQRSKGARSLQQPDCESEWVPSNRKPC